MTKNKGITTLFSVLGTLVVIVLTLTCMQVFAKNDKYKPTTWYHKLHDKIVKVDDTIKEKLESDVEPEPEPEETETQTVASAARMSSRATSASDENIVHFSKYTHSHVADPYSFQSAILEKLTTAYSFDQFISFAIPIYCDDVFVGTLCTNGFSVISTNSAENWTRYCFGDYFEQYVNDGYVNFHLATSSGLIIDEVDPEMVQKDVAMATTDGYGLIWAFTNITEDDLRIVCQSAATPSQYDSLPEIDLTQATESEEINDTVIIKNNVNGRSYTIDEIGGSVVYTSDTLYFLIPKHSPYYFEDGEYKDIAVRRSDGSGSVHFTAQYGRFLCFEQTFSVDPVPYEITYIWSVEVDLPEAPIKEGHDFVGWFLGTESECDGNCTKYESQTVTTDMDLHAHFSVKVFTVTYNSLGGSAVEPVQVEWNTAAPMPETTLTGYTLLGWYLLDGNQYNGEAITRDTELTAHWGVLMLKVTFYVDGEVYKTLEVKYGSTLGSAMKQADLLSFGAADREGVRVSKLSTVTEDSEVFTYELTGMEKIGDYIGQHAWALWCNFALIGVLIFSLAVAVTVAVKRS